MGMCLDPTDEWVYVATSVGIVEWRVRERDPDQSMGGVGGVATWR